MRSGLDRCRSVTRPADSRRPSQDGETGFLFAQPSAESFLGGIRRAFEAFGAKDRLDAMRRSAMARSFSWDLSAACYNALYRKTIAPSISRVIAIIRPLAASLPSARAE